MTVSRHVACELAEREYEAGGQLRQFAGVSEWPILLTAKDDSLFAYYRAPSGATTPGRTPEQHRSENASAVSFGLE